MPVAVRQSTITTDHFPAPRSLIEAVKAAMDGLHSVELMVRQGRRGYGSTGLALSMTEIVDNPTEEAATLTSDTPDHIAERIVQLAVEHAQENGPNYYRADGYKREGKGAKQEIVIAFRKAFPVVFDEDANAEPGMFEEDRTELVQAMALANTAAKDHHGAHMKTVAKLTELAGTLEQITQAAANVFGSAMEWASKQTTAEAELEQARMDHEETMEQIGVLGTIGEKLAPGLGDALGQVITAKFGSAAWQAGAADPSKSKAEVLREAMATLDEAGKQKLSDVLGREAEDLLNAACESETDEIFDQRLQAMIGHLRASGDHSTQQKLNDLGELFPEDHKNRIIGLIMTAMGM